MNGSERVGRWRLGHCSLALLCAWCANAQAADIALVGLLPGRAMVMVDGGKRQIIAVGQATTEGVKLLAIESGAAVFEAEGKRRRVQIGQSVVSSPGSERPTVVLTADPRGHFVTQGSINGTTMRFIVDTGATLVSIGAADARRAHIDTGKAKPAMTMTANGPAHVWRVRLDSVRVGDITLTDVDGVVHEQDMPVVLLGMSFLNRMEIRRDGESMTLIQRY